MHDLLGLIRTTTKRPCFVYKVFVLVLISSAFNTLTYGQTPGFIFQPSVGGASVFDPDNNGYVSQNSSGFSNDGYDVDEFEIKMFSMPTLGSGEVISDLQSGPSCGFTDFSVDSAGAGSYAGFDASNNLVFRFRLSSSAPNAKGYSVLIDTDQKIGSSDPNYTLENPGFEICVTLRTKFGVYIYNVDGMDDCSDQRTFYPDRSNYQKAAATEGPCGSMDVFYDFYIPFSALTTEFGITTSTPIRFASATNTSSSCPFQGSLSDVGGVDDDVYGGCSSCALEDIGSSTPPFPLDSLCSTCSGFPPAFVECPSITTSVIEGITSFDGNAEQGANVIYRIYNNVGTLLSADTVVADGVGQWTSNTITPGIAAGDSIVLSSYVSGKSPNTDCAYVIAFGSCSPPPLDNGTIVIDAKGLCGDPGNAIAGAEIRVYKDGSLLNPGSGSPAPVIVAGDGSWIWKCNNNSGCNGGPNCLADGTYLVTQQDAGECESTGTFACLNPTGTTATPVVNSPLGISDSIKGTSDISATVYVYINGVLVATTIADVSGAWFVAGLELNICDSIQARASGGTQCISAYSNTVIVSQSSAPPTLTCGYNFGDMQISGTGIGQLGDLVFVTVYDFSTGLTIEDTASLTAFNNWVHLLDQPLDVKDSIKVRLLPTCGIVSEFSNTCIVPDTSISPRIDCSLNYKEGDTLVAGTLPQNGLTVSVFIDGDSLGTAFVSGGSWQVIFDSSVLYTGGIISSYAEDGVNGQSKTSNTCQVVCSLPDSTYTLSYSGGDILPGTSATLLLDNSDPEVFYELYDVVNNVPAGQTTFGSGTSLNLNTLILNETTMLVARAFKLPPVCEIFMRDTITITVLNVSVTAVVDSISISTTDTAFIPVLSNDIFQNTIVDTASLSIVSGPFNGTATINADGSIDYIPNIAFTGADSFAYSICDTSGIVCDTAFVFLQVAALGSELCGNGIDDDGDGLADCLDSDCSIAIPDTIANTNNILCEGATNIIFSTNAITNATAYNWYFPNGTNIVSGNGTTSVTVNLGTVSGDIYLIGKSQYCQSETYSVKLILEKRSRAPGFILRNQN
ncbi:MAG: Ig-like domain-containing protein [Chitinophagales bacterium]|nr:Ig-like domain-containing protein [Chitinophagales bacterium]